MPNSLLEIKDLRVAFVDENQLKPIVKGVSFSIRSGSGGGSVGVSLKGAARTIPAANNIATDTGQNAAHGLCAWLPKLRIFSSSQDQAWYCVHAARAKIK
jgi:ABC-type microcin C transport system duplicated ATPase subunit YejF